MMDPGVRQRLANIAARLASDHDGEVVNAARLLIRGLAAQDLTIADLFAQPDLSPIRSFAKTAAWSWNETCAATPGPHVEKINELLQPRWGMLRSHRTEKVLRTMRLAVTLADDEAAWLDTLHAKMVLRRSELVAAACANFAEDFSY